MAHQALIPGARFNHDDHGAAAVVAGMITFAIAAALIPAATMYHDTLREEMDAHTAEARHQVELARALAAQAQAAAEAAAAQAEHARQEAALASSTLDLITALSDAAEANADLARAQAAIAKKGAFCARTPGHPECALADKEWLQGYSCDRVGNGDVVCTKV